ncbi:MAG TPA: hypothetical protein DHE23_24050 [Agrobacterium sp.]|nr:hypothetical protein [Agrobacterium sp.]
MNTSSSRKPKSLFRITYRDGATLTTTAATSVLAGAQAERQRPGAIKSIKFLKKVSLKTSAA